MVPNKPNFVQSALSQRWDEYLDTPDQYHDHMCYRDAQEAKHPPLTNPQYG